MSRPSLYFWPSIVTVTGAGLFAGFVTSAAKAAGAAPNSEMPRTAAPSATFAAGRRRPLAASMVLAERGFRLDAFTWELSELEGGCAKWVLVYDCAPLTPLPLT